MKKYFLKPLAFAAGTAALVYGGYIAYAYRRYGRPDVAGAPDPLLDRFMPDYEVRDYHRVHVDAPPALTMTVATKLRLDEGRLAKFLFAVRSLPGRLQGHRHEPMASAGLEADATALGWGVLASVPARHLIMGGVTRPWEGTPVFERVAPDSFAAFNVPDYAKIAWGIRVQEDAPGTSILTVETRVQTTDADSRRKFRRYWAVLSPGIKAIRYEMLDIVKKEAERAAREAA